MAIWQEFESSVPGMAATARLLWPGITALHRGELTKPDGPWFLVAFLATIRPDGSPRLHPFCPILAGGRLFAAIPHKSPKGHDLRRDHRDPVTAFYLAGGDSGPVAKARTTARGRARDSRETP